MPSHRFAVQTGQPEFQSAGTVIKIGDVEIGGAARWSRWRVRAASKAASRLKRSAEIVAAQGAQVMRGGAFKPRSSPYSFQGMGEEGLKLMREAADRHGLLVVSEVMDQIQIPLLTAVRRHSAGGRAQYAELQFAARSRQDSQAGAVEARYRGHHRRAAAGGGIHHERRKLRRDPVRARHPHIRNYTRNTMDISAIPVVKKLSHLPMVGDPSHGTGRRDMVLPMARAAVAAGADGLMVEVHPDPDQAVSDGAQTLTPPQFTEMMQQIRADRGGGGQDSLKWPAVSGGSQHRRRRAHRRLVRAGAAKSGI